MRLRTAPRPAFLIAAIVGLLVAVVVASTAYEARRSYKMAIASAEREAFNAQRLLVEHTERTFEGVARALEAAAELYENVRDQNRKDEARIHELLQAIQGQSPVLRAVGWTDADGNRLYSSLFRQPPRLNVSDQEAFTVHAQTPHFGVYIAAPIQSRVNGEWIIPVSRRIDDRHGSFAGVV